MRTTLTTVTLSLLIWFACAASGLAGAWMREPGKLFFAVSTTLRYGSTDLYSENAIYAEYGLSPKVTIGFDYNHLVSYSGHALVFFRLPVGPRNQTWNFAVETAAGGHHWLGDWHPMFKYSFSAGRGIETRRGFGWLSFDAAIEQRTGNPGLLYKLDATLGLPEMGRIGPIFQLETAKTSGYPLLWTVTPGLRYKTKKLGTLLIGLESKHGLESTTGLKFGFWRDF